MKAVSNHMYQCRKCKASFIMLGLGKAKMKTLECPICKATDIMDTERVMSVTECRTRKR